MLDLYVCLRPVRWFKGVPSPVKEPGRRGHGDLPREHRGHLRRHRVPGKADDQEVAALLLKEFPNFDKIASAPRRATLGTRRWKASARRATCRHQVGVGIKPVS
jgi:isocitrate dehydrogenase